MNDGSPRLLACLSRLQAIAQNGITYTKDPYDLERFQELRLIIAELLSYHSNFSLEESLSLLNSEIGALTPKIDVRGAIFQGSSILLVKEKSNGLWSLPGGWAEVNETASESVCREIWEESGFRAKVTKPIAILCRNKYVPKPRLPHVYKILFLCEILEGSPRPSLETSEVAFFNKDALPELSEYRVTRQQVLRCFQHFENLLLPTDFD
ncbi:MAG: hypothetical protein K0S74_1699 [Chlamydiales bacterium]|jgi:ADP-ribose pyrophosphatase YjhB (NUDIX family)|nr:hypothetical protein [Chlamydiales bacterium]